MQIHKVHLDLAAFSAKGNLKRASGKNAFKLSVKHIRPKTRIAEEAQHRVPSLKVLYPVHPFEADVTVPSSWTSESECDEEQRDQQAVNARVEAALHKRDSDWLKAEEEFVTTVKRVKR